MEILETQERKMNKNKEKKRELTHFLGHYPLDLSDSMRKIVRHCFQKPDG